MSEAKYKDPDLVRIKHKINLLKKVMSQGPISYLIKIFISWMVTLELTNGIEKVTVQEILLEFQTRINKLDTYFNELEFSVNTLAEKLNKEDIDPEKIKKEIGDKKIEFRAYVYKLFDLNEIFNIIIKKCIVLGSSINKLLPYITNIFSNLTIQTIDSILLTNTDKEFEDLLMTYLDERVETIIDTSEKKMKKIKILQSLLKQIVGEKNYNSYDIDSMIEMNNM